MNIVMTTANVYLSASVPSGTVVAVACDDSDQADQVLDLITTQRADGNRLPDFLPGDQSAMTPSDMKLFAAQAQVIQVRVRDAVVYADTMVPAPVAVELADRVARP